MPALLTTPWAATSTTRSAASADDAQRPSRPRPSSWARGPRSASTDLAGSPIRVEALNVPQGGIDAGTFGYYATFADNPKGLAKFTVRPPGPPDRPPAGRGDVHPRPAGPHPERRRDMEQLGEADARAPGRWPDSAAIDDAVLAELLDASCQRLRAYAPALPVDAGGVELAPDRYVLANVYDARDLWTARTLDARRHRLRRLRRHRQAVDAASARAAAPAPPAVAR